MVAKNGQPVSSFAYALSFRKLLKQLVIHSQTCNFFILMGSPFLNWGNTRRFEFIWKFPVSTVLVNNAFKISEQQLLLLFKTLAILNARALFALRLLNSSSMSDRETWLNKGWVVAPNTFLIAKYLDDSYT